MPVALDVDVDDGEKGMDLWNVGWMGEGKIQK